DDHADGSPFFLLLHSGGSIVPPPIASLPQVSVHNGELRLSTRGDAEIIDITADVQRIVSRGPVNDGLVTAFVRGSTAAITTMEFEPGGVADLRALLDRLRPAAGGARGQPPHH